MDKAENLQDYRYFLNNVYIDILDSTYKEVVDEAGFKYEECVKGIDETDWMKAYNFIFVPMMKVKNMVQNNGKPFNSAIKEHLIFLNRKMNMIKDGIELILTKEFGITVGWVNKNTGRCEFVG